MNKGVFVSYVSKYQIKFCNLHKVENLPLYRLALSKFQLITIEKYNVVSYRNSIRIGISDLGFAIFQKDVFVVPIPINSTLVTGDNWCVFLM